MATSKYWVVQMSKSGHGQGYGTFKSKKTAYKKARHLRESGKRSIFVIPIKR